MLCTPYQNCASPTVATRLPPLAKSAAVSHSTLKSSTGDPLSEDGQSNDSRKALLDACELAVHYSKSKNASRADVHIVPIKNVKKPKGAKPGLVMVHGGRTLHLRRTPARPPLPKLHALVEGLCAAHEGGKGIDHTTTLGLRFLDRC